MSGQRKRVYDDIFHIYILEDDGNWENVWEDCCEASCMAEYARRVKENPHVDLMVYRTSEQCLFQHCYQGGS